METGNAGTVEAVAVGVEKRGEMRPVGDLELLALMVEMFGSRRAMELVGWASRWALTGEVENADVARRRLLEQGLARSSVYRALVDLRAVRDRIDATEGRKVSMLEFFTLLRVNVSYVAQPVVQS